MNQAFAQGLRFCNKRLIKIKYIDAVGKSRFWEGENTVDYPTPQMLHLPAIITGLQRGRKKTRQREICLHIFPLLCWAHLNYNVLQARVGNFVP